MRRKANEARWWKNDACRDGRVHEFHAAETGKRASGNMHRKRLEQRISDWRRRELGPCGPTQKRF